MKTSFYRPLRTSWASGKRLAAGALPLLAILMCSAHANAQSTISFSSYADGMLASANNPYDGILNLQAETGHLVSQDGETWTMAWTQAAIQSGVLELLPTLASPSEEHVGNYYSKMSASFLQPIADMNFSVFTWRHAAYSFSGVDAAGDIYNGGGTTAPDFSQQPGDWLTINLDLPTGYSLTSFSLENRDPSPADAGIWIQQIAFTTVPEPRVLTFFCLIGASLLWMKAGSTRRRLVLALAGGLLRRKTTLPCCTKPPTSDFGKSDYI